MHTCAGAHTHTHIHILRERPKDPGSVQRRSLAHSIGSQRRCSEGGGRVGGQGGEAASPGAGLSPEQPGEAGVAKETGKKQFSDTASFCF